ncbi:short-chain dehydrogenase [Pseudoalteromonas ruthenica]|uniref:Short-chain dehydrogenase n=1 Tax=Pseudoalteromonas ruthenica TaxID=151081 RepID=A0A5S3Z6T9_9GAMM|nr:SDR family oxidoreductase [Pseudoalteromonas ruthenica]TMP87923.1 short-chain dehydrogenase [Pseudoalteromonas ruthenica]
MRTLSQLQQLNGQWALITGGAGHVGHAAAQTLLELGAHVILLDRSEQQLQQVHSSVYGSSDKVHTLPCELSQPSEISTAMAKVSELTQGKLNILINNAAFVGTDKLSGWCVPFEQQSLETFNDCLNVNLSAPFQLCQHAYELMKNTPGAAARIVNISSIYGVVGPQMDMYEGTDMGNPAAYATSKAGLMQLTRWLAANVAPRVRVNNIVLGGIERGQPDSFLNKYNAKVPLARMATEEDVKGAIAYLCSELSNYMTGQSLFLDGGWTAI